MSSKRLSKDECRNIAHQMTDCISKEIEAVNNYFKDLNRQILESRVPEPILSLFYGDEKLAKYINKTTSGYMYIGKRYIHVYFDSVPANDNIDSVIVPEIHLKKANEMYDKKSALEIKQKLLIRELEEILYKLATPRKITEHLPEALPFLPSVENNELPQINLEQFREKLRNELGIE